MAGRTAAATEGRVEVVVLIPRRKMGLRRELRIESHHALGLTVLRQLVDVERWVGAREGDCPRLTLGLVLGEEVCAVAENWSAKRAAHLLIRVRQDALLDEVGGIEPIAAEETGERAAKRVGSGFGDGVRHHSGRSP